MNKASLRQGIQDCEGTECDCLDDTQEVSISGFSSIRYRVMSRVCSCKMFNPSIVKCRIPDTIFVFAYARYTHVLLACSVLFTGIYMF